LAKILFFNAFDLQNKLNAFQSYYNETRVHSSLGLKTPSTKAEYHQSAEINKKGHLYFERIENTSETVWITLK